MPQLLDYVSIKGFKSIRNVEKLQLKPLNVLIGANGSGKSNLIGFFSFLHEIREGKLQEAVGRAGGAENLLYFGSRRTKAIETKLSFMDEANQYELTLLLTKDQTLFPAQEAVLFWSDKKRYDSPYSEPLYSVGQREAGISKDVSYGIASWVRARLGSWRIYHVHDTSSSSPLRRDAKLDDNSFLRPDGGNLAAYLYLLKSKNESEYSLIRGAVQRVAPYFEDFVLAPSKLNESYIKLAWKHRGSEEYFDASSFSDGTLRFVLLATLFLQPKSKLPSLILVDEPELGLHPYAIEILAGMVRAASTKTQVLIATQSAQLLDNFDAEDIVVADRVEGSTRLTRVDAEGLQRWLNEYSLGELWEKNFLAGRPSPEVAHAFTDTR